MTVKGMSSDEFSLLNSVELVGYEELMKVAAEMDAVGLHDFFKEQIEQRTEEGAAKGYSPKVQQLMKAKLKMEALRHLLMYKNVARQAKYFASGLPPERWQELEIEVEEPGVDYYSSLESLYDINGLYFTAGLAALRSTSNLEHLQLKDNNASAKERFLFFKENAPDFFKQNAQVMDLVCVQFFAVEAQEEGLDDQKKEEMFALLSDSIPGKLLIEEHDRLQALVESAKQASGGAFTINEVPQVENDKVLDAILEQYRGKVVLVDFWATWCGPCIASIEPMKPVKKNMADKDVVFVYLTDGSSPIGLWSKYLPEIGGQHYRLSDNQMQHLRSKMGVEGIPTFFVFDKEGQQIDKHTGFPGAPAIEASIEKGLN
jgi:thiol-disulfide isomerase/thioredoxin